MTSGRLAQAKQSFSQRKQRSRFRQLAEWRRVQTTDTMKEAEFASVAEQESERQVRWPSWSPCTCVCRSGVEAVTDHYGRERCKRGGGFFLEGIVSFRAVS